MVRQCVGCHRFVMGAASPDVAHGDVQPGANCGLPHHPLPCPWVGKNGEGCTFQPQLIHRPPPLQPPVSEGLQPPVSRGATFSQGEASLNFQQQL